jgi:hypothetical protein
MSRLAKMSRVVADGGVDLQSWHSLTGQSHQSSRDFEGLFDVERVPLSPE